MRPVRLDIVIRLFGPGRAILLADIDTFLMLGILMAWFLYLTQLPLESWWLSIEFLSWHASLRASDMPKVSLTWVGRDVIDETGLSQPDGPGNANFRCNVVHGLKFHRIDNLEILRANAGLLGENA